MSKTRLPQILFSLAVIAAMIFAAAPAPVYALSASTTANSASIINQVSAAGLSPNILVCRVVVVRHNGHLIVVRRCHRVERPV